MSFVGELFKDFEEEDRSLSEDSWDITTLRGCGGMTERGIVDATGTIISLGSAETQSPMGVSTEVVGLLYKQFKGQFHREVVALCNWINK